jgi:hypothetical protein
MISFHLGSEVMHIEKQTMSRNRIIRDFIYMDVERIRSFVAQVSEGLTSEKSAEIGREVQGESSLEGSLPFIAKATGGASYHFLKSSSETKSLHDHIFEEFFQNINSEGMLTHVAKMQANDWREDLFTDGNFFLTTGLFKIVDYQATINSIDALPDLINTIVRITSKAQTA